MADKIPAAAGAGPMLIKPATWEALRQRVEDLEIIPDPTDFSVSSRGGKKWIRLRGVPGATRPGPPPIPALTLSAGATGARIYKGVLEWCVTTLNFERIHIVDADGTLLDKVNNFIGQDAISGVQVMQRGDGSSSDGGSSGDDDDWWPLAWWGDVWAKVILNPETGEPESWDLVGPDKPDMIPIPELDGELSRGSNSGDSGGEIGYVVKIGTVPEDGRIIQDRTGNLEWFCAFVPEGSEESSSAHSSASSDSGPSGGSSSSGSSGPGGDSYSNSSSAGSSKDTAVVPTPEGYRKWYAMESTQVMFFDFPEIDVSRGETRHLIDPIVLFCLERGTARAFVSPERGAATVRVVGDEIIIRARHFPWPRRQRVQVMLYGIRRGFRDVRLAHADFTELVDNECRLNPRMTRAEVLAALAQKGVTE